jgi:hypothetical protein
MSRLRIFHLHGDVTIVGEGLQMLGAQGLCATLAVTQGLSFSGLGK